MTTLTIDEELDRFEALQVAAAARRRAETEAAERAAYAKEQAAKAATKTEAKAALRACLDEYCDLVRSLDAMPLNGDAWRQLHLVALRGNRLIRQITGTVLGTQFNSPAGGGFVETVFKKWGLEISHSTNRETYTANIKPLAESLRVDRVRVDVERILSS